MPAHFPYGPKSRSLVRKAANLWWSRIKEARSPVWDLPVEASPPRRARSHLKTAFMPLWFSKGRDTSSSPPTRVINETPATHLPLRAVPRVAAAGAPAASRFSLAHRLLETFRGTHHQPQSGRRCVSALQKSCGYVERNQTYVPEVSNPRRSGPSGLFSSPASRPQLVQAAVEPALFTRGTPPAAPRPRSQLPNRFPIVMARRLAEQRAGSSRASPRPGGNVTGLSRLSPRSRAGKRAGFAKELLPDKRGAWHFFFHNMKKPVASARKWGQQTRIAGNASFANSRPSVSTSANVVRGRSRHRGLRFSKGSTALAGWNG